MALYREQGIVLRTTKLGEADRILHLLSPGRGQLRAVAKGVRRTTSRFGGRLEPYSHVDLQLAEGRSLDVVTQVELIAAFAELRADWVRSACASAMVEVADRLGQPDEPARRLFLLLLDGLRALREDPPLPAVTLDAYLLRVADAAGYRASVDRCAVCGRADDLRGFASEAGGAVCAVCAPRDAQRLDAGTWSVLAALAGAPWSELAVRAADEGARRRASAIVSSYLTHHLGHPVRALAVVPR